MAPALQSSAARTSSTSPASPRGFKVNISGLILEVASPDTDWLAWNKNRFSAFLSEEEASILVTHRPDAGEAAFSTSPSQQRITLKGACHPRFLDTVLIEVLPALLEPSLVVHGTLLRDGSRAYLCCGQSGAGKSTLAAMLPEHALCDELAAIRPTDGGFEGVSLPYWVARPGSAPLASVFILEHATSHRRTRIAPGEAIRELRRHICWPTENANAMTATFTTLTRLVQEVPVYRLGFRKDPGVWDVITEPTQ